MNEKQKQLEQFKRTDTGEGKEQRIDSGSKVSNDQQSLRAGRRGPLMFRDTTFYRKQSRFNRERIPEKVVHARGFGLYGEFELTESLEDYTIAKFLTDVGTRTPVFTRFSNFVGSKGSKDTAVDIRGFAVKFYTTQGNYDMLGLQFPIFVLNDAMKFMDVVHAAKPNQTTDVPQASVAHDHFWDYVSSNTESANMVLWLMSMRGRPRSWRMMEGWPINTFRFVNKDKKSTFVRFKWIPKLGVHSLLLDEANIIGGLDPDFHRNDIIEAVKKGVFPEFDLGVQLIREEDEFKYEFDVLDATKFWPEEIVPVKIVGKLKLNKLVDNFFAEEEQSSFDPSTLVPGIEFSNDPVLQGRAFAYRDTDYHRLGTGNINEIPVNRPLCHIDTNHRDGYSKYRIDVSEVNYRKNHLADNTPETVPADKGGYEFYEGEVSGRITRELPSDSFNDHFRQARMFFISLAPFEQKDLIDCLTYHLQKVKDKEVRERNVDMWAKVDKDLSDAIADNINVRRSSEKQVDENRKSPALSSANTPHYPETQRVAVLIGNNFSSDEVFRTLELLKENNVFVSIISEKLGAVTGSDGRTIEVTDTFKTSGPELYDSLYIVGGEVSKMGEFNLKIKEYFNSFFINYKPIALSRGEIKYLNVSEENKLKGIITPETNENFSRDFLEAITTMRFWNRQIY